MNNNNVKSFFLNSLLANPLIDPVTRVKLLRKVYDSPISESCFINPFCFISDPKKLLIGPRTFINHHVMFDLSDYIIIEKDVDIAMGVKLITASHLISDVGRRSSGGFTTERIIIRENSWIGADSLILPGVDILSGSVIAAGSVVPKGKITEPDCLWAGNPIRKIRRL